MNYLAHLFLSPDDAQVRVGNLMGDFVKGSQLGHLPDKVEFGVMLHRKIDRFTDQQPEVKALKQQLSSKRKRFSGIIADIVFDHLLAKHWVNFSQHTLSDFASSRYQELLSHQEIMPAAMQLMTNRMVEGNWLESYIQPSAVGAAIDGVSRRIRFENDLLHAFEEVEPLLNVYQQTFFEFFPKLEVYAKSEFEHLSF